MFLIHYPDVHQDTELLAGDVRSNHTRRPLLQPHASIASARRQARLQRGLVPGDRVVGPGQVLVFRVAVGLFGLTPSPCVDRRRDTPVAEEVEQTGPRQQATGDAENGHGTEEEFLLPTKNTEELSSRPDRLGRLTGEPLDASGLEVLDPPVVKGSLSLHNERLALTVLLETHRVAGRGILSRPATRSTHRDDEPRRAFRRDRVSEFGPKRLRPHNRSRTETYRRPPPPRR